MTDGGKFQFNGGDTVKKESPAPPKCKGRGIKKVSTHLSSIVDLTAQ
jgi:hypothetical protein